MTNQCVARPLTAQLYKEIYVSFPGKGRLPNNKCFSQPTCPISGSQYSGGFVLYQDILNYCTGYVQWL